MPRPHNTFSLPLCLRLLAILLLGVAVRLQAAPKVLPDSLEALLSDSEARADKTMFLEMQASLCCMPGAVPLADDSIMCRHPFKDYIDAYNLHPDSAVIKYNYLTSLSTFDKFRMLRGKRTRIHHLSHKQYLTLLQNEQEVKKLPWLMRVTEPLLRFLRRFVWEPFKAFVLVPLLKLSWQLKILVITAAAMLFLLIAFAIAKAVEHVPIALDLLPKDTGLKAGATASIHVNWLARARACQGTGGYGEALESIYKWQIGAFSGFRGIYRSEWWTNRQFLELVAKRFPARYRLARDIIVSYERGIYGHCEIDREEIGTLIDAAGAKPGSGAYA